MKHEPNGREESKTARIGVPGDAEAQGPEHHGAHLEEATSLR